MVRSGTAREKNRVTPVLFISRLTFLRSCCTLYVMGRNLEPKGKRFNLRLDEETRSLLTRLASALHASQAWVLREAIRMFAKRHLKD